MNHYCAITLDGQTFQVNGGANLLASLLAQGVIVPHSCLAGACGSCRLFDGNTHRPLLACQHTVVEDMVLTSAAHNVYDMALHQVSVRELGHGWSMVSTQANLSLPIGAQVLWQCGEQVGQSFCCSQDNSTLDFYVPTNICKRAESLRLASNPQRQRLDPDANFLLLYCPASESIARHFSGVLTGRSIGANVQLTLVDLAKPNPELSFQRYDVALVIADEGLTMEALENWLTLSRCRVNEFIYLINHS